MIGSRGSVDPSAPVVRDGAISRRPFASFRRLVAYVWLAVCTATLVIPSGVAADAIASFDPASAPEPDPAGHLLSDLFGLFTVLAIIGVVIALLVGAGLAVSRIGSPPAERTADRQPVDDQHAGLPLGTLLAILVALAAGAIGLLAGRAFAYLSSQGGLGSIFARGYLILLLGGSVIALTTIGLTATKFRHGHVSPAIATVFGSTAVLVVMTFIGMASAAATGGTYHEPVVLVSPAKVQVRLESVTMPFTAHDGGQGECRSVPDGRSVNDLAGLDLGALGPGTLRVGFTLDSDGLGTAAADFFIDGGSLPEGSPMISWAGIVAATTTSADRIAGQLTFSGLRLDRAEGKPAPESTAPQLPSDWPASLSGTLTWACQPWSAPLAPGVAPPPSRVP